MKQILQGTPVECVPARKGDRAAKCDFGEILFSLLTGNRPPEI